MSHRSHRPHTPRGDPAREGGVSPRAAGGGMRARVEGVLAGASASATVFDKGLEIYQASRVRPTLYLHVWHVIGDTGPFGTVTLYSVNLLEPSCQCQGMMMMGREARANGAVCKHVVAAGCGFLAADNAAGGAR